MKMSTDISNKNWINLRTQAFYLFYALTVQTESGNFVGETEGKAYF